MLLFMILFHFYLKIVAQEKKNKRKLKKSSCKSINNQFKICVLPFKHHKFSRSVFWEPAILTVFNQQNLENKSEIRNVHNKGLYGR